MNEVMISPTSNQIADSHGYFDVIDVAWPNGTIA